MRGSCRRWMIGGALLSWFALVPIGAALLVRGLGDAALPTLNARALAILAAALFVTVPFGAVLLLVRHRPGWRAVRAVATALLIGGGYVLLDAVVRTILPQNGALVLLRDRYAAAGLRLVALVPYAVSSGWLAPRLMGLSDRSVRRWLGLGRLRWSTFSLSLAAAALVTSPWPVTGALGDGLASLALSVEMVLRVVPQVLVFWGVVFYLLTTSFARAEAAAAVTILIYALGALGRFLPGADSTALAEAVFLLPLGLLLAELRVRGGSVFPLFAMAFCYQVAPLLFVDPRDAIASGIPELQHLGSYVAVVLAATILGSVLWLGRRVSKGCDKDDEETGAAWRVVALAVAAWGSWAAIYLVAGEPGFSNHGFLVILEEQANLEAAYDLPDREARLSYVYQALVETAETSQSSIRDELDALDVPYRPHYIINMVRVDGHRWLMEVFEGHPGVARVLLNPNVREYPRRVPFPYEPAGASTVGVEENLVAIGADDAWARGVDGTGIVVGGQDTGYAWYHPALRKQYRGWDGQRVDHNHNWHDAWDDSRVPFDDGFHGTHTMGTVLGDDGAGNRIGVAPGAQWIGCRNMRRGFGNPGSYAACMEFLLAPFPLGGDPFSDGDVTLAPHVINNSWGCPPMEGCFPETLRTGVEALRAAGIMMVVSAGNEGPACGTATVPPANYEASFSVGATTVEGDIVGFSSRGPADGLTKPDVAAPGQRVRSSVPGGDYAYAGGTSMAAPHVAGTVALLWSADAGLVGDVDRTEQLLCSAAEPREVYRSCAVALVPEAPLAAAASPLPCACGGTTGVPNNVYGCGVVDTGAAVKAVLGE